MSATLADLDSAINAAMPDAVRVRHALHRVPETSYEEVETAKLIRAELDRLGIAYTAGVADAPTATVAVLGDPAKPCVALRADIDALPIAEQTGVAYASTRPGFMHACGHDGHTSILLATAAVLKDRVDALNVCVKLIWQPAEEGGAGANRLVKAGVLDGRVGPRVTAIYGLHGWPGMPVGMVTTKPGPLLAATDTFKVTFRGRGCHGAFPHLGRDPIVCCAEAILSLQQVVSREVDPTEPALITVGIVRAGTATNVIPDEATIHGTIRTLTPAVRKQAAAALTRRCEGVAAAHDCTAIVELSDGYPATINDPERAAFVADIARRTLGEKNFTPAARASMGGEDFAYYAEQCPACFFLIGVSSPGETPSPPLHSDRFDFADDAIAVGVRMFAALLASS